MRIGITYDLRVEVEASATTVGHGVHAGSSACTPCPTVPSLPDDFQEEFDSPVTIEAIAAVLRDLGHEVEKLGDGRELLERLLADPPELVFNIAEGQGIGRAREARVPAVLEMLGIPYTGSDPLTLAVTLDKDCAKRLVQSAGVAVPRGVVITDPTIQLHGPVPDLGLGYPVIVKPAWEGSSKGIRGKSVVDQAEDLRTVVDVLWRDHRQPVLIEEFIQGDELTVGILGNEPPQIVGIMRVVPTRATDRFIYSLEVKRDYERQVHYECPAPLGPQATARVEAAALAAYRVLGCRDVSRVDFRLRDGVPYFLEVNPLPGLNPHSGDLVILSGLVGWTYSRLVGAILDAAVSRPRDSAGLARTIVSH